MTATAVIIIGALLLLTVLAIAASRGRPRAGSTSGMAERERSMAAQADVEEHDIEEMIEARNELRRRTGRPSIGDDLADEAREDPDDA